MKKLLLACCRVPTAPPARPLIPGGLLTWIDCNTAQSCCRHWSRYQRVLSDWRAGISSASFPGGEDQRELVARLRWAMTATLDLAAGEDALIVAHGGSSRAALPGLTGLPDPGHDLATGCCARFEFGAPGAPPRLRDWPASPD